MLEKAFITPQKKLTAIVSKDQSGQRLDQAVVKLFPAFSRSCIQKWISSQLILVDGTIWSKPKQKVSGGEKITIIVDLQEKSIFAEPQNIPLNILYEDEHLIIIDKPKGLVVHPGAGKKNGTILNALLYYHPSIANVPRSGIIHRLDKDTTGLMIIAKTIISQMRLTKLLKLRKITREYEAIVIGHVKKNGVVNQPIGRHPIKRTKMCVNPTGKPAITHFYIIKNFRMHTHLKINLDTGRTHQIRVHMAYINHPLIGDQHYGNNTKLPKSGSKEYISILRNFNRQALHATTLRFYHPIFGKKMEWKTPIPKDMKKLIDVLYQDYKSIQCS